jgi:hypothetical protein
MPPPTIQPRSYSTTQSRQPVGANRDPHAEVLLCQSIGRTAHTTHPRGGSDQGVTRSTQRSVIRIRRNRPSYHYLLVTSPWRRTDCCHLDRRSSQHRVHRTVCSRWPAAVGLRGIFFSRTFGRSGVSLPHSHGDSGGPMMGRPRYQGPREEDPTQPDSGYTQVVSTDEFTNSFGDGHNLCVACPCVPGGTFPGPLRSRRGTHASRAQVPAPVHRARSQSVRKR